MFLTNYTFLPQLINGVNMSKAVKKYVIELQEHKVNISRFADIQGESFVGEGRHSEKGGSEGLRD